MRPSCVRTVLATFVLLVLCAPPAVAELDIPTDGFDLVELADRRVIRCKVGEEAEGGLPVEMEGHTFLIPASDVAAIRYFRDFDSTPTTDAERTKVEKGFVKWEGKWVRKKKADKLRGAEEKRLRKIREADEKHSEWKNRWIVDTKHFRIEANIPRAKLDHYAETLEGYYENVGKQIGVHLKGKWKKFKLPVYFYKHREEYLKRRRDSGQDKGEHALGHFVPTPGREELVMFDQNEDMAQTLEVLYHEATHFLIYLYEPNLIVPRWMNEGCAEFYSGSTFHDGQYTPGLVHDGHVLAFIHAMRSGKLETIERLLESGNQGASPALRHFPGRHYHQSWLIVHYCMNSKRLRKRWQTYLKKILDRKVRTRAIEASARKFVHFEDDLALFKQTMKVKDTKAFQKDLMEYAEALPLREARGYLSLGRMQWITGDTEAAAEAWAHAERVAEGDSDALFELAMIYRHQGPEKRALAARYIKEAVDLDPLDVRKRYVYSGTLEDPSESLTQLRICHMIEPDRASVLADLAILIFNEGVRSRFKPGNAAEEESIEEAFGYAQRAVEIAPEHRSRNILAILHMHRGEFKEAYELQAKAVQEEPEDLHYRQWLATFAALGGNGGGFAKTMRKTLLLQRGEEVNEDESAAFMERLTRYVVTACTDWDRMEACAEVLKVWYRRPPRTEREWLLYIRVLKSAGDREAAEDAKKRAAEAFPDSDILDDS